HPHPRSVCLLWSGGGRRALRPFPTRRSSDLAWVGLVVEHDDEANAARGRLTRRPFAQVAPLTGPVLARRDEPEAAGGLVLVEDLDRKSTRLNSSHVKISYAVFCLKKKKSPDK